MKHQKTWAVLTALTLSASTLAGCGQPTAPADGSGSDGGPADASSAVKISLNGDSASVDGDGAAADGSTVTIGKAGTYLISGTLNDGQIVVDAGKNDAVTLILDGAQISCSDNAAIYAKRADVTTIHLSDGTLNAVSDGVNYVYPDGGDEPDAAIFSKDDLTITGGGALTVTGSYKNGIGAKDNLTVESGILTVTAVGDGLRGRDSVTVSGGELTIDAQGDGVKSNNDEDVEKGLITISGGSFTIVSGNDGIQAETALSLTGGSFDIVAGGGSANAPARSMSGPGGGGFGGRPQRGGTPPDGFTPPEGIESPEGAASPQPPAADSTTVQAAAAQAAVEETAAESLKGLKAGSELTISGGTFTIDSTDDAVHSNGELTVTGGELTLSTGDDGFHADSALVIEDGNILIASCYEGLEGSTVDVNGGEIRLTASDDGVNAAGGSDGDFGDFGPDSFRSDGSHYIRITGGILTVDAGGDGLDSNGNLYLDGGVVLVNGPTGNGDGALDYDGDCEINGGILAAAGSSGMAQSPGSGSQNVLSVYFTETQSPGTLVNLSDSAGVSLMTFAPSKQFQSIVLSVPELAQGQTYILSTGGSCEGEAADSYYGSAAYSGGTKLTEFKLNAAVTRISSDGSEMTGGMGGGPGGLRGGPGGRGQGRGGAVETQSDGAA